ncbi:TraR/DksA C4-type zinc finger protein [Bordetella sp. FB-8]|uniref:TraR/DksA family transcriptional regulator n=1 Tax=Bordetella sp. FB-8 TaxID=1159870 RepID=UPI00036E3821|nr:TraR/DksA C4-type zinc finger protein [Bordetella sp. FB-8]
MLADLLQSRLARFEDESVFRLNGLTQAKSASQTLMDDADDARQRAGDHEVEGIVSDIDSREFNAVRNALQRIHLAGYGLCLDCHAAIPFDRLRRQPETLRCASCQALYERKSLP